MNIKPVFRQVFQHGNDMKAHAPLCTARVQIVALLILQIRPNLSDHLQIVFVVQ